MNQQPRWENAPAKVFVGINASMSFDDDGTGELWRVFMPRRREITGAAGAALYSIEQFPPGFFDAFASAREFTKWAAIAVEDDATELPLGMDRLISPAGPYAVFMHRGPVSDGPRTYGYIFNTWIPQSDCAIDERPHLAVMGPNYANDSADSEEELWIPVRPRTEANG